MANSPTLNKALDWLWYAFVACFIAGVGTAAAAGLYALYEEPVYDEIKGPCVIREVNDNRWFFEDIPTVKTKLCPEE